MLRILDWIVGMLGGRVIILDPPIVVGPGETVEVHMEITFKKEE